MIFRYKIFQNELINGCSLSFIVIEDVATYANFFAHLESSIEHNSDHFSIIKNGIVQKLDSLLDWVQNNWRLGDVDRKMLNSLYSQLDKEFRDTEEGLEIIAAWYRFQDLISQLLSTQSHVTIQESIVGLPDIYKLSNIQFNELPNDNYLERLQDYLTRMVEHSTKKIFLFENLLSYMNTGDVSKLFYFCETEDLYIVDIESTLTQKITDSIGRVIVIDEDNCELVIREP